MAVVIFIKWSLSRLSDQTQQLQPGVTVPLKACCMEAY